MKVSKGIGTALLCASVAVGTFAGPLTALAADGSWQKDGNQWSYVENGQKVTNSFKKIDGAWYYLDGNGHMAKGLTKVGNDSFYFDGAGVMKTKWVKMDNGDWRYFISSGEMASGRWLKIDGIWYWFQEDGVMASGLTTIKGSQYAFRPDGALVANGSVVSADGNSKYYTNADGIVTVTEDLTYRNSYDYPDADGWKDAYISALKNLRTLGGMREANDVHFTLINLDGDQYPEIFVSGTQAAPLGHLKNGFYISSYNPKTNVCQFHFYEGTDCKYIPGSGMWKRVRLLEHKAPKTGWHRFWYTYFYQTKNSGAPVLADYAYYYKGDDRPGHENNYWKWNSQDVSQSVYNSKMAAEFDDSKAIAFPYGQGGSIKSMMDTIYNK